MLRLQTREWKDGLLSTTFRDMANNKTNRHQWIVLDGDIDAEWVESCNTVMVGGAVWGQRAYVVLLPICAEICPHTASCYAAVRRAQSLPAVPPSMLASL